MPVENFEERKQARIERYKQRAEKAAERANEAHKRQKQISDMIPFGQPILVGHHSEGRHRADIKRLHSLADRAVAESNKADYWGNRAESAEKGRAISSDDPEAAQKLQAKIDKAEKSQQLMTAANKIIRRKPKNEQTPDKLAELVKLLGLPDEAAAKGLFKPDFMGRVGFPGYSLSNNNANIKRMKARVADLERATTTETKSREFGACELVENAEENRVQINFKGQRVDKEVWAIPRKYGFIWSRRNQAWQRLLNDNGRTMGQIAAEKIVEATEGAN